MKKETLLEIILGTIGGLVFAIGMCMCLLPEWNVFTAGVITIIIGFVILLCIIPVYRSSHPKKIKEHKPINWGIVSTWTVGIVGALIMGFGMSKILVGNAETSDMIVGLITGVVGLLICVLNYPVYAYIKSNKK
ncbi:MAG: hypothetical protein IJX34_03665 [Clostridia bacterium]|nr:hypothetical protein [Clostridia bacterium]